ncbi:MAG: MAPEG family protein [Gammaproteobacteria bacterium]|nr:MAPEG family protein [Gammaproteobacteria bacterium]
MSTIIICSLIAVCLPYLAKVPLGIAMNRESRYDNKNPREQQARLTGFGARTLAAHQNSFEALIIFGVAIAVVLATNTTTATVEYLAITHIVARVIYCVMYYINQDKLRSLSWFVATACPLAMIWLAIP